VRCANGTAEIAGVVAVVAGVGVVAVGSEAVVAGMAIGHRDVPDRCKANGATPCGACDDGVQSID
jgi:hypothetical protein